MRKKHLTVLLFTTFLLFSKVIHCFADPGGVEGPGCPGGGATTSTSSGTYSSSGIGGILNSIDPGGNSHTHNCC